MMLKLGGEVIVFRKREQFVKIVVWVVVLSMLLTVAATLASAF
ncbi:MAG: hypothetical protein U9N84_12050 [Actinomycetota bacterium]|nr:hypothetical protein [Actinomycetota bacterium]